MLAIAHVNTLVNAGTAASLHTYEYINKLDLCVKRRGERERGGRREREVTVMVVVMVVMVMVVMMVHVVISV